MPESLSHITTESQWRSLVLKAGGKYWHVYMSKKTAGGRNTARYLGRYLKKPPIAASRLAHYNGGASLSFRYLDHKTGETATETLTQRELVARLKQHIPEKFFKMVRYYGFLSPAKRRLLEDVVYAITETVRKTARQITRRGMYQQ